jgi:3-oxoacyl-[acyl-carrier protein] reductase
MLIIITGASKGIGYEMVKQLSLTPGMMIVAVSRNTSTLNKLIDKKNSPNILPLKADITKASDRKKIALTIKRLQLKINVLIHNAGALVNKPFSEIKEKEVKSVYETNVFGPFHLTQTLLPYFDKKKRGHIVNIGSIGGVQGSSKFPGLSAYSSSKAALSGLTECLAEELKQFNIHVNCLALGAVQTEMLSKAFPGYKAPLNPAQMANYICNFALTGQDYFNGKILSVSSTTP